MKLTGPTAVLLALLLLISAARAETRREVVDLEPRPGVMLRLLVITPPETVATVLLFTGGDGRIGIGDGGDVSIGGNFLIRTRDRWAENRLRTVLVDAPSDHQSPERGLGAYRLYAGHARDIAAVIAFARSRAPQPVWLVGTSRGTLSVANAAVKLGAEGADGIVLTSTILRGFKNRGSPMSDDVFDLDLASIQVPVLIAHHRDDGCPSTLFADIDGMRRALTRAREVGLLAYEGGAQPISSPCEARSQHGYFGMEGRVVFEIANWIKARSR